MKVDPLVITLCAKASQIGKKVKKEKDLDKKIQLMQAQLDFLRLAELIQLSMNIWLAIITTLLLE